jgi:hypothetical protein
MGLRQPAASRTAVHRSRDPQARHPHRDGQPDVGHRRVHGELVKPGHPIAASTVWQILRDAGIGPAPAAPARPGLAWQQFLTVQARGTLAAGFAHVDTVLLPRTYALIVIEHGTRRVHLAGITANPDGARTTQAARNFLMGLDRSRPRSGVNKTTGVGSPSRATNSSKERTYTRADTSIAY